MRRLIFTLMGAAAVLVTSCMLDPHVRFTSHTTRCASYGYEAGSLPYATCMQAEELAWQHRYQQSLQRFNTTLQAQQAPSQPPPAPPFAPRCHLNYSYGVGGAPREVLSTTCY